MIQDQSRYIHAALHEINVHLVLGSILASLVVLAFMRSWRSTLIAAVAIPSSVISTFGMMWVLDFTLNSVTMLALVLMVGIVIDDAIVVLENIFRFVEEKGMSPFEAARAATADIGLAVMATTFSLVVIFIPVSFMSSISGRFLYQFGITAAVAVLVSLLVSFTLTPMMSARLLGKGERRRGQPRRGPQSRGGFYRRIDARIPGRSIISLRHRAAVALVSLGVMLSIGPALRRDPPGLPARQRGRGGVRRERDRPAGDEPGQHGRDHERHRRARCGPCRGVRLVLSTAGGGWIGGVSEATGLRPAAPHEERVFSISRLLKEHLRLRTPWPRSRATGPRRR